MLYHSVKRLHNSQISIPHFKKIFSRALTLKNKRFQLIETLFLFIQRFVSIKNKADFKGYLKDNKARSAADYQILYNKFRGFENLRHFILTWTAHQNLHQKAQLCCFPNSPSDAEGISFPVSVKYYPNVLAARPTQSAQRLHYALSRSFL